MPCTRVVHTFEGEATGDQFGWVSAPLPDVDGDGVQELVVGAPFHDSAGSNAGRIYVYDGRTGLLLFHADGGAAEERLGHSVRDAGDLDGDGVGDVLAGGPATTGSGVARVFSGADGSPLLVVPIGGAGDGFGFSVASLGDVDGDHVPDLAVGATREDSTATDAGRAYVVSGADGTTVLRSFLGEQVGDGFGSAVSRLGDVNGDGVAELAVGAGAGGPNNRGKVYVFDVVANAQLWTVVPDASGASFGQFFVDPAGHIDADAFPDLYVGDFSDGGGRGKAYVFSGVIPTPPVP